MLHGCAPLIAHLSVGGLLAVPEAKCGGECLPKGCLPGLVPGKPMQWYTTKHASSRHPNIPIISPPHSAPAALHQALLSALPAVLHAALCPDRQAAFWQAGEQ